MSIGLSESCLTGCWSSLRISIPFWLQTYNVLGSSIKAIPEGDFIDSLSADLTHRLALKHETNV